ncbi:MAG: RNA polymerase sigma-70 factor (ECF subfamily) [Myxococcota bacterium]|jgi:RNA polymerase sigma-70 factor (ECF subfamily)
MTARSTAPGATTAVDTAEMLYRKHGRMVMRRVRCFFSGSDVEEVLQEVFVKVLEKVDSFRRESSPTTWLYRLTTNHCIERLRRRKRRGELMAENAPMFLTSTAASQEDRTFAHELFSELDEETAQLGVYYYLDGMTHAEIARVAGCSARTVGNRLETLRIEITARLGRDGLEAAP